MNLTIVSTILESLSFFLVTLDLYGKDRLEKSSIELVKKLKNASDKEWDVDYFMFIYTPPTIYLFIAWLVIWALIAFIISNPEQRTLLMAIAISPAFPLAVNNKLLNSIILLFISTISKYKLDGVMLKLGVVFYILSKIIPFAK